MNIDKIVNNSMNKSIGNEKNQAVARKQIISDIKMLAAAIATAAVILLGINTPKIIYNINRNGQYKEMKSTVQDANENSYDSAYRLLNCETRDSYDMVVFDIYRQSGASGVDEAFNIVNGMVKSSGSLKTIPTYQNMQAYLSSLGFPDFETYESYMQGKEKEVFIEKSSRTI